MKFLKQIKNKLKLPVVSIPDQDVALLAMMCDYCNSVVKKRGLINRYYGYYVPQHDEDIDVIKSIFERNGIHMETHLSHIFGAHAQLVLRVSYDFVWNGNKIKQEMEKIEREYNDLYLFKDSEKKANLQKQVMISRQKQK